MGLIDVLMNLIQDLDKLAKNKSRNYHRFNNEDNIYLFLYESIRNIFSDYKFISYFKEEYFLKRRIKYDCS